MKTHAFVAALVLAMTAGLAAQTPPPGQGTMATEGAMSSFYKGLNTIVVTTIDGVEHVYHFTKNLIVHGGKAPGPDALSGLKEGTTVVVHYTVHGKEQQAVEIDRVGDEGLQTTEGVVVDIDRGKKQITLRFENGRTETLRLTERAAAEAGKDLDTSADGTHVIVYYADEKGQKVAHYFKKAS